MTQNHPLNVPRPRLNAKLRQAIALHVREALPPDIACQRAGLSRRAWDNAMTRPAVLAHLAGERHALSVETVSLMGAARAKALEVAVELMTSAKSEAIRSRMASLLARSGAAPVGVETAPVGGYIYVRSSTTQSNH